AIQKAEEKLEWSLIDGLAGKPNAEAKKLIQEAHSLVNDLPISESKAGEKSFNSIFKKKRKKSTTKVTGRQAEVEQEWDSQVKANYSQAEKLAKQAAAML
ncbi:uncharacterized protein METZ01_LOCUS182536, partial [marine metagenome]